MNGHFRRLISKSSFDIESVGDLVDRFQFDVVKSVGELIQNDMNRYLMLFFDSEVTKIIFRQNIQNIYISRPRKISEERLTYRQITEYEHRPRNFEVKYLLGSSLFFDQRSKEYSVKVLSKIKHYSSEPTLLILDNLDIIYGALYDLFNKRFAQARENRYCNVVYEDFKDTLSIHAQFRCLLFKNETDFRASPKFIEEKLPSPLMNRFEKHLFHLRDLGDKCTVFECL